MFKRKDVIRSSFLFLLIVTIMITLSQILVVHQHNHQEPKQRDVTKLKSMIRDLERNIDMMLKKNVLPLDKYEKTFQAMIYSKRIAAIVESGWSKEVVSGTASRSLDGIAANVESGWSKEVISGTSSRSLDGDKTYFPSTERKTRLLQNLDVGNHSRESVTQRRNPEPTRTKEGEMSENQRNTKSVMPKTIDGVKDLQGEKIIPSMKRQNMKSRVIKGNSWSKYRHTLEHSRTSRQSRNRCPEIPNGLGRLQVDVNVSETEITNRHYGNVLPGGAWQPRDCISRHRVAIVIPFRDRWSHLRVLLHFLIPVLQRQQLNFRIFVVEQHGNKTFNKGRLMNAGFTEACKIADFDCFIFHDVDLIPEDDRNMYTCPQQPRHMSPSVDKFKYNLKQTFRV